MILIIFAIAMTLAYQVEDNPKTAQELDQKVRESQPYQDFKGDER